MPTDVEIIARREMPGLNPDNVREINVVIVYRVAGDASRVDHVMLPVSKASDSAIRDAIAAKERAKGGTTPKRITID